MIVCYDYYVDDRGVEEHPGDIKGIDGEENANEEILPIDPPGTTLVLIQFLKIPMERLEAHCWT